MQAYHLSMLIGHRGADGYRQPIANRSPGERDPVVRFARTRHRPKKRTRRRAFVHNNGIRRQIMTHRTGNRFRPKLTGRQLRLRKHDTLSRHTGAAHFMSQPCQRIKGIIFDGSQRMALTIFWVKLAWLTRIGKKTNRRFGPHHNQLICGFKLDGCLLGKVAQSLNVSSPFASRHFRREGVTKNLCARGLTNLVR